MAKAEVKVKRIEILKQTVVGKKTVRPGDVVDATEPEAVFLVGSSYAEYAAKATLKEQGKKGAKSVKPSAPADQKPPVSGESKP